MYATLEMLKMFDACGAGYGRVLRAVGGTDYGMEKPIPLWIGATTTSGLGDVDWILQRGVVIDPTEFAAFHTAARPLLFDYVQFVARSSYAEQYTNIKETLNKGRKNGMNTMGLKILAIMDACVNLRSVSEADLNMIIRFVEPAAFNNHRYQGFKIVREALLAYANKLTPTEVVSTVADACRMNIKHPADFDRPWKELLIEKHQEFCARDLDEDEDEDEDYLRKRMVKKAVPVRGRKKVAVAVEEEPGTVEFKVNSACSAYIHNHDFSTNYIGLSNTHNTNKDAIGRFLALFNQKDFFNRQPITGERTWNGMTMPNDINLHNPVDVLTQRDADGNLLRAVFAITDPTVARQVARFVRVAELNVAKNVLSVGEEDANGNVTLNRTELKSIELNNDDADEDEDEDDDEGQEIDEDDEVIEAPRKTRGRPSASTLAEAAASINLTISDLFRSEREITQVYVTRTDSTTTTTPTVTVTTTDMNGAPVAVSRHKRRSRVVS